MPENNIASNFNHYAYYGEYSIKSWIDFVLNGEIKLPDYQRSFVWNIKQSTQLVDSIKSGRFVQPLTIASTQNELAGMDPGIYLLDGQQRISSIILLILGVFPNGKPISLTLEDDEDNLEYIEWNFSHLQLLNKRCVTLEELREACLNSGEYIELEKYDIKKNKLLKDADRRKATQLYEEIWQDKDLLFNKNLGYSFVKSIGDSSAEKKLFANLFREINSSGQKLTPAESRKALYYLEPELINLLEPKFLKSYKIGKDKAVDFPRYLSYAYRYKEICRESIVPASSIAKGYSNKQEEYIIDYVHEVINEFNPQNPPDYFNNLDEFEDAFLQICPQENIESIAKMEMYSFGLIFWCLLDGKKFDASRCNELIGELNSNMPETSPYEKVGGIRNRLKKSVEIYERYMLEGE
ncbi:MAG: DUF262 domain-containing protein [Clostridiales bacterium]|nr:DUF262 domain-containing protein [Clostridiales bacterium]